MKPVFVAVLPGLDFMDPPDLGLHPAMFFLALLGDAAGTVSIPRVFAGTDVRPKLIEKMLKHPTL